MKMPDSTHQCNNDCRIQFGPSSTTCAYYPPVYDKHGNNINPDRNTTHGECWCRTCGKKWLYATQLGETTYTEQACN